MQQLQQKLSQIEYRKQVITSKLNYNYSRKDKFHILFLIFDSSALEKQIIWYVLTKVKFIVICCLVGGHTPGRKCDDKNKIKGGICIQKSPFY